MFCLRGEKPAASQSISLPSAYLYLRLPNPTIALPHIFASSPVACLNISKTRKASFRRTSFSTEFRNSSTLASVLRVLGSYLAISFEHLAPGFVDHDHSKGIKFAITFECGANGGALFSGHVFELQTSVGHHRASAVFQRIFVA